MKTAIVLFNRDLRVHDHPALAAAVREAESVLPLFVFDEAILRSGFVRPNRVAFLLETLADLDDALAQRGSRLLTRRGDVVRETLRLTEETGAEAIFASADVSGYAQARERRIAAAAQKARVDFRLCPGVTVLPPGDVITSEGSHFSVFTPYFRQWADAPRRALEQAPRRVRTPTKAAKGALPKMRDLLSGNPSPERARGGEGIARRQVAWWLRGGLGRYEELHDDLAADGASRFAPYLHFGCISPLELRERAAKADAGAAFVRQLCWRDFYAQLLDARPETSTEDMRSRGDRWSDDDERLEVWKQGLTGYPVVDAGMRQLLQEGYMHNRARLITASFLTKDLYVDWREGARHFYDHLTDGDVANNVGNWQWVAGTGADTRPNRVFNPTRQARRFDPDGDYVRRYVPELAEVEGDGVHEPWSLGLLRPSGYPEPLVDHAHAAAAFKARRAS